jgi:hypothetical protein
MTEKLVALQIRVTKAMEAGRESGQGATEYVGAIFVAGGVVAIVIAAFKNIDVASHVTTAITKITTGV